MSDEVLTAQAIFTRVVEHLRKQKRRSVDSADKCRYRSPEGLRCAVGAIMPDEAYSNEFEQVPVGALFAAFDVDELHMEKRGAFIGWRDTYKPFAELLRNLQMAHDHSMCALALNKALRRIQEVYSLAEFEPIAVWEDYRG